MIISERYVQNVLHIYQKLFKSEATNKEERKSSLNVADIEDKVFICTEAKRRQISETVAFEIVEKLKSNASSNSTD
ncbi:MAG: DVU0524 family FlgM-associated protein [Thermodesulfobacteriota bacterium]|nr:DVU0524 family FlgM-associated protein [Thermodesulfobacteriota bacterium]